MRRHLIGCLTVIAALCEGGVAQTPSQPESVQAQVAAGEKVFDASCGNQYCHGSRGNGGQGPRLSDFPMSLEHIRATVREGRSGTNMAPFKDVLEPAQLEAVIAYVLWISSAGKLPKNVDITAVQSRPENPGPSATPTPIGNETGTPIAGAEVFFDATRLSSCRTCHTYGKRGGPLGVDFADAGLSPETVLASVSKSRVASRAYPVITIRTADNAMLTGIRGTETEKLLRVFDVVIPPVQRSFRKSEIVGIQIVQSGIFDHTKLGYTHRQLLDVAAFVGTTPTR
jgi:mono/diheme cytochrome c family protein